MLSSLSYGQTTSTLTDTRDGQIYKTITINGKTWMAQNLNYVTSKGSYCYIDQKGSCYPYGRLYAWEQTFNVCPINWHLPSDKEWQSLIDYNGGDDNAGIMLQAGGSSGFNAILGGYTERGSGYFPYVGELGFYWSSTSAVGDTMWIRKFYSGNDKVSHYENLEKHSHSVRCIQD